MPYWFKIRFFWLYVALCNAPVTFSNKIQKFKCTQFNAKAYRYLSFCWQIVFIFIIMISTHWLPFTDCCLQCASNGCHLMLPSTMFSACSLATGILIISLYCFVCICFVSNLLRLISQLWFNVCDVRAYCMCNIL